jgi:putative resolvase
MFLSAKQVKERYHITSQTLYNWRRLNKINYTKLPSGSYVYTLIEDIGKPSRFNVLYARVSNTKQKDDLIRQCNTIKSFMVANGKVIDLEYTDIASGMNESRKSFNTLIEDVIAGKIDTVYITYNDRLTRFGFGYIKSLFEKFDTKIVSLNSTKEEDFQTELTQDLISIIHHFSMKMYSARRKMLNRIRDELKNENI